MSASPVAFPVLPEPSWLWRGLVGGCPPQGMPYCWVGKCPPCMSGRCSPQVQCWWVNHGHTGSNRRSGTHLKAFWLIKQHRILPKIIREDSVTIGMDYLKSKYSKDTDIDDVNGINQTTHHVYNFGKHVSIVSWQTTSPLFAYCWVNVANAESAYKQLIEYYCWQL